MLALISTLTINNTQKRIGLFILALLIFPQLNAYGDELIEDYKNLNDKNYKEKYELLNDIVWKLRNTNPQKALETGRYLLQLSDKINDIKGKAKTLNYLGAVLNYLQEFNRAYDTLNLAIKIAERYKDSTEIAYAFNNIGGMYRFKNQYVESVKYILKALEIFEKTKNQNGIAYCAITLGLLYLQEYDFEKALYNFKKSESIRNKQNNLAGLAKSLLFLGDTYFQMSKLDSAMYYYDRVLAIYPKVEESFQDATVLSSLSNLFIQKKEYQKAKNYAFNALEKAKKVSDKENYIKANLLLSEIYILQKEFDTAQEHLDYAFEMASEMGISSLLLNCYAAYSNLYESLKNYPDAILFKNKYISLEQKIFNETRLRDIAALTAEKEMAQAEYQNLILKKDLLLQAKTIEKGRTYTIYLILILLLSVGISVIVFILFRVKSKTNKENIKQKHELEKLNEELIEVNQSKDKFFSIIAHDMKSPFQGLLGCSQMLTEDFDTLTEEEKKEVINTIHNLSLNSFRLLENLLEWSRLQTGKFEFKPERFNARYELNPTIRLLMQTASNKGIVIENKIDETLAVNADKNMIQTVIRNLVSNAIKFTKPEGSISIISDKDQNYARFIVADNGIGINKNKMEHLFRVDKNESTAGTANEEGTGLGLLLCKEMIEMHMGKIWVESEINKGSKFIFTIPMC
ncbi:MAG: tetratricopeptide repeat-containing sensor histidine kinase [bacterium]